MTRGRLALAAIPVAFVAAFFVWPVVSIIATGLAPGGRIDLSPFGDVLGSGRFWSVAWFTLWQAVASTLLTLVVAIPAAGVVARYRFRGKKALLAFATIPFVLPTVVVATAFLGLFGDRGVLPFSLEDTVWAILIAHVFFNVAVVLRMVSTSWAALDPRLEDAARTLGASRLRAFREVTLPLLRPSIAAASSIVFLFTFTSFGIVLILGGPRLATLEVEIYRATAVLLDLPAAAVLALMQLVGVGTILWLYARYQERHAVAVDVRPGDVGRPIRSAGDRLAVGSTVLGLLALLGTPIAVLVWRAFTPNGSLGLGWFRALSTVERGSTRFVEPLEAVGTSLRFGVAATLLALVVGLAAAVVIAGRRGGAARFLDALLMLPLGTSAVTVGFGFLVALDWPIDLRTSVVLIPIAHAIIAVPFVVRSVVPPLRSIRARLREAARVLGATPWQAWRTVDLPIVGRALVVASGFAFAISLGEFGATLFIARPDAPTLPVAIFRFLGRPGAANFGRALAMSVILMAVTAAAIALIERFRPERIGDF